ncbi:hybrid sensor histidine kinase/response regulator [Segetibacter sp. 3557_3]|uniref:hybrid sensor histidine kinase/response regulator transcription factor n=1 Tax=Segetibacter sp. 3557_3 TaxID=2547429 RepID=UPI001058FEF1|nr:two-component regulator propeller domain-containing protein [Segetibacter sp. 3557_3]TDH23506.1 hybrid sensor histidine kinase/response regulator [Segetibacter sp. 3557_3]
MFLRKLTLAILCLFGWICVAVAQSADIKFTTLTTRNGLSSNNVNTILKDRYGLIWFGTEDGLNKFDGTHFTIYRHKAGDTASLQSNEIIALHEDQKGNLWIGTSGGSLSRYNRTKDAFINYPSNGTEGTLGNNVILSLRSDHSGRLWIGHYAGVNIMDPRTGKVTEVPVRAGSLPSTVIGTTSALCEDFRKQMWIGTDNGVFCYNNQSQTLTQYRHAPGDTSSLSDNFVHSITNDSTGNLWIGTNEGLSMFRPETQTFRNFSEINFPQEKNHVVNSIVADGSNLWLGTAGGVKVLNTATRTVASYTQDPNNIYSVSSKLIRVVYRDNLGIFWFGTIAGGVSKYDQNLNLFNFIPNRAFAKSNLGPSPVSSFAEYAADRIYVGMEDRGLQVFNPKTRSFQHVDLQSRRNSTTKQFSVLALAITNNRMLAVGTYQDGLFIVDPVSGNYQQLLQGTAVNDVNSNSIFCLKELSDGNLWAGTNGNGINVINKDNKVIRRLTPNPQHENDIRLPINGYIRDIAEDSYRNIWIATHGGGIAVFNPATKKFIIYSTTNSQLPNDKVQCLLVDSKGYIWAGTFGEGIGLYDKNTGRFNVLSEKDGLQNSTVYSIVEDNKGLIWVSTNKGISSIDPGTKKIVNYNEHNGVQNNSFFHAAGAKLKDGTIFFGGQEGMNYFHPEYLKKDHHVPVVLIRDLKVGNQSVVPSPDGPLTEHISVAKEINLDFKQNFTLEFVGLDYSAPEQNQYAYKLEGFDKEWNYVGTATTATYTNIDPGTYTFHVRASNNDGVWNDVGTSIRIRVHPPFWRTIYAYIFYALVILGLLFFSRYKGIQKIKRRFRLEQEGLKVEQERKEALRTHELDLLKIKFLTNLSHEFRTPISLILGPVETMLSRPENKHASGDLQLIRRNGRRLLNLVNQLLDFRKMEEHELQLHPSAGDLISFIKDICESFRDLAERKNIHFVFESELTELQTLFDHDKIERILFNLLSNAFKFTLKEGTIRLKVEELRKHADPNTVWVCIKVNDTGIGIPEETKNKIFDVFFQNPTAASILNQGTGIGLSITKEFVKMQGGRIDVESQPNIGSTFSVELPFVRTTETPAVLQEVPDTPVVEDEEEVLTEQSITDVSAAAALNHVTVLLVEDDDDFRFYLKDNLRLEYRVIEAGNGKEGWQKALSQHPQLIVSDISMPEMNGIELCKKIKSDKRTSHIPVILLTALTAEEDQLQGLRTGANDYITKPFNFELLSTRIKNLLVLNESLKKTYTKQIKTSVPEIEIVSSDEKLMKSIVTYLEENLTNPQLSVEDLSRHVGMSRSSLYNKLLQLTGQTPVEYIRSLKLEKAAVLLERSDMNIAQIAYSVGFSSPNYFAKSFKSKYNMLPSEYVTEKRSKSGKNEET